MAKKKKKTITWDLETKSIKSGDKKVKKKKKCKLVNPYSEHKFLGYFEVLFSFFDIWFNHLLYGWNYTKYIRFALVIVIPFFLIYGLMFTITAIIKIFEVAQWTLLPYQTASKEFYWGMAFVGLILIIVSIYGISGIYRKRLWSTKVFAVVTYIYAQASLTVSLSWFLLVNLENSNIALKKLEFQKHENQTDNSFSSTPFIEFFVKSVLGQSILLLLTGILTAILFLIDSSTKGFTDDMDAYRRLEKLSEDTLLPLFK